MKVKKKKRKESPKLLRNDNKVFIYPSLPIPFYAAFIKRGINWNPQTKEVPLLPMAYKILCDNLYLRLLISDSSSKTMWILTRKVLNRSNVQPLPGPRKRSEKSIHYPSFVLGF